MTVLLTDLIVYEFCKNRLSRCHDDIFTVHETLGRLDAAIAIASYRASLGGNYAVPGIDFSAHTPYLRAEGMVHPMLTDAVPNDIDTARPILITGSNASGKSTFLKTAALCVLMAQSICTCPARSYTASAFRIYSSMALEDSLETGESYYIVETRSLRRILHAADSTPPMLCVIDEVLRGTNTVERIAASSTVLAALADRGALCLTATHDIELCDLLCDRYTLFHFTETVGEDSMHFDCRIRPGKATSRNAINLLRLLGFDDAIVDDAHRRANEYLTDGVWR
jgi:DNA mismatch repair ATPase MutS